MDFTDEFRGSWIREALFRVAGLKILVLTLAFDPAGLQAFSYPKSLLSRGTEWVLCGLILLAVLRYGARIVPRTPIHLAIAAYALAVAGSAALSGNAYVSLFGEQDSYQGLTLLGDMAVLYLAIAIGYRGPSDFRFLALTMVAAALVSSAYSIVQFAGFDPLIWNVDPSIRPFATFGNPNQLAHYLSVVVGLCLGFLLFAGSPRFRVGAGVIAAALVLVSGLTGARAGVLGLAVALAASATVAWRGRTGSRMPVLAVALVALVLSAVALMSPTGQRLVEGPVADRLALYKVGARAFAERPIFGYGPDQFSIAFAEHRSNEATAVLEDDQRHLWAHNFILQTLVTTGAVGGLTLAIVIAMATRSLWRALATEPRVAAPLLIAWTSYWAQALFTIPSVSVDWFPWVALGIAAALGAHARKEVRRRALAPLARGAVITVACAAALTGYAALRANHDAGSARASLSFGLPERALAAANSAVSLDGGRADYWNWLGVANEAAGEWAAASAAYTEAVRRADYVATYWANLARARAGSAMTAESRVAYARALAIDPLNPVVRRSLADTSFLLGDCDEALEQIVASFEVSQGNRLYASEVERAATCVADLSSSRKAIMHALRFGEAGSLHAGLARISLRAGDIESARAEAQRAIELDYENATAREILELVGPGG